jgi:hypothetical protein
MRKLDSLIVGFGLLAVPQIAVAGQTVGGVDHAEVAAMPKAQRAAMAGKQVSNTPGRYLSGSSHYSSSSKFWNGEWGGGGANAHVQSLTKRLKEKGFSQEMLDRLAEVDKVRNSAIVPGESRAHLVEDVGFHYENRGSSHHWNEYISGPGVGGSYSAGHYSSWEKPSVRAERIDATGKKHGVDVWLEHETASKPAKAVSVRWDRFSTSDGRLVMRRHYREETIRKSGGVDVVEYQTDVIDGKPEVRTEIAKYAAPSHSNGKAVIHLGASDARPAAKGLYEGTGRQMTDAEQLALFQRLAEEKAAAQRAEKIAAEEQAQAAKPQPVVEKISAPVQQASAPVADSKPVRRGWRRYLPW